MIDKNLVENISGIAKLKFKEDEIEEFTNKFGIVLNYVDIINEIEDEENLAFQVHEYEMNLRKDEVEQSLSREDVLMNTKESEYGYFKFIKFVE